MRIKTFARIDNKNFTTEISKYVKNLPILEDFKKEILDPDFINEILSIYTKYPHLFGAAFSIDVSDKIRLLNIAGFLYHRSIIYMDKLLDNQTTKSNNILLITICQEECIKILASIFPLKENWEKI